MAETNFRVDGKVALVTGAGRGMGLSIARVLAEHGARVAIQDLDLAVAEAAAKEVGAGAIALGGDITDPSVPAKLVGETVARLGEVDILINNAAVQEKANWLEATVERLEWQWRGNFLAPLLLTRLVVPGMQGRGWGRVVNLSSVQGKSGNTGMLGYSSTKAAINNMTMTFGRDFARSGVTVNAIAPGYFNTYRNRDEFEGPEDLTSNAKWVPMGRAGAPKDIAGAALLLCSDAGAYITGQIIYVDGGMAAH